MLIVYPKNLRRIYLSTLAAGIVWLSTVNSSVLPFLGYDRRVFRGVFDKRAYNETTTSCFTEAAPTTIAPTTIAPRTNPWAPLTPEENLAVWKLLHHPASGLNLTDPTKAKLTDNYVSVTVLVSI
jgi:primary-amine oxidase